jgi:hypothetical protein
VIGKVLRGGRPNGLIRYLYGPGKREEHTDPHIVAGWRDPAELEPRPRADGRRDFRRLNGLLNQPHAALGPRGLDRPVWHCVVRAAPEDRMLSDDEWGRLARDIMDRTGLAPRGQDDDAVRWVAVRHADDHIHVVAMPARQDGARPRFWNDFYRVREACQAAEERHGLRRTAPGDRTAGHRPTRAENEKARRHGREEAPRVTLRRAVSTAAAGAASEEEFFARLRDAGVLVRTRFSTRDPGQVTGYAVALGGDTARGGEPVWFGGGKLAADLSLPKLRCRWGGASVRPRPDDSLTAEERNAIWEHAARAAQDARDQIRAAVGDPGAVSDAAWAASDTLHVAAAALGSRVVRQAADSYARAARVPYARIPSVFSSLRSKGIPVGCGSCEVSWLRCEDKALAVSGVVDAFVLAAEVEAPVGAEVAGGDDGAQFQDSLGTFEPPSRACYVHSVLDYVPAGPLDDPGGDGPAFGRPRSAEPGDRVADADGIRRQPGGRGFRAAAGHGQRTAHRVPAGRLGRGGQGVRPPRPWIRTPSLRPAR